MWWWPRCKAYVGTLLWALLFVGVGSAMVTLSALNAAEDTTGRALAAFVGSAVLWVGGLYLCKDITVSADLVLIYTTPLSSRRYFLRNLVLVWPLHFVALVLGPLFITGWAPSAIEGDNTPVLWDRMTIINAFLLYYVMLFGPLAENFGGPKAGAGWLFVPRYLIRRQPKLTFAIAIGAGALNSMSGGVIVRALRDGMDRLLALGDAGYVALAALSPVSAVGLQTMLAPVWFGPAFAVVLAMTLVLEVTSIARGMSKEMDQVERETMENWIEQRAEVMVASEEAADQEADELEEWKTLRATYKRDIAEPIASRSWAFEGTTEESRFVKQAAAATFGKDSVEPSKMATVFAPLRTAPFLALLAVLITVWGVTRSTGRDAHWWVNAAIVCALLRSASVPMWWDDSTKIALGLPLRIPQLIAGMWRVRAGYDLFADICAVGFFVLARGLQPYAAVSLVIGLQLIRTAAHLAGWLRILGRTGKTWFVNCWTLYWIGIGAVIVITLIAYEANLKNQILDDWRFLILVPATLLLSLIGQALALARVHRRTDYSLLVFRSSYSPAEEGD